MPTPKKGYRLGGSAAHQRLILRNLATALFEHGKITTTEARARFLRPFAEKLITKAKKANAGSLHDRRMIEAVIYKKDVGVARHDNSVSHRLVTEIAEMFKDRPGGYTRITKIGPRKGDNAPMAVIELVTEDYNPKPSRAKKAPAKAEAAPAAVVEEAPEEAAAVEAEVEEVVEAEVVEAEAAADEPAETQPAETESAEAEDAPKAD